MGISDHDLEGGLFEAFQPSANESVLAAIERLHGAGSSILLRETQEDVSPVLVRRPGPGAVEDDSRYQILGEIARGGIGVIYKGRDKDLNRDIALKVLRPEYAQREDVLQRFVEEAQVAGQLQHPGIVPVYGLGLQADGRPSFAMKLIKGQTLAELLDSNPRDIDLLAVFEQVAQTMAYAHSRGVIHRDLKPANVMVGAFGEVQVVDWGFAKVLGQEDVPQAPERTVIATVRSGPVGSQSIAGSVMGTPAYMPPEQAMGRIDDLDERSDVFALGAILCELLTGKPPYTGEPKDQLIAAAQSRLEDAFERLAAASAAEELKQLARDCLDPLPSKRPRNARTLAERLTAHLSGAEERARQAELDAVTAETDAIRAARARRRALMRAAVALFVVLAGGGGFFAWKSDRDAREAVAAPRIAEALREATRHEGEQAWDKAAAAAQRAVDIAASEGVDDASARRLLDGYQEKMETAERARELDAADETLFEGLERARALLTSRYDPRRIDAAYARAVAGRWPSGHVDTARLQGSPHASALAAAFDTWAHLRRTSPKLSGQDWKAIDAVARAIEPAGNEVRDAVVRESTADLLALVERADITEWPPERIAWVGGVLRDEHQSAGAVALLARAQRAHPGDFWINYRLGNAAQLQWNWRLAARHYAAALAIRPASIETRHWLGMMLDAMGDTQAALDLWRDAVDLDPEWATGWARIAWGLGRQGKLEEALDAAERAVRLDAGDHVSQIALGVVYWDRGTLDRAAECFREAGRLEPADGASFNNLGGVLVQAGRFEEAIAPLRRAIELRIRGGPRLYLGHALRHTGDYQGALDAYADFAGWEKGETKYRAQARAWQGILLALHLQRKDEAVAHLRAAYALDAAALKRSEDAVDASDALARELASALLAVRRATELEAGWQELWADVDALPEHAQEAAR